MKQPSAPCLAGSGLGDRSPSVRGAGGRAGALRGCGARGSRSFPGAGQLRSAPGAEKPGALRSLPDLLARLSRSLQGERALQRG